MTSYYYQAPSINNRSEPLTTDEVTDFEIDNLVLDILQYDEEEEGATIKEERDSSSERTALVPSGKAQDYYFSQQQGPPQAYYRKVGGRRRSNNPTFMPGLRILKRDIRRRYGEMFLNVTNSHDIELLDRFLKEFTTPSFVCESSPPSNEAIRAQYETSLRKKHSPPTVTREEMVQGFGMNYQTSPDMVLRMKACQVRVRQGSQGSRVIANVTVTGTRLFYIETVQKKTDNHNRSAGSVEDLSSDEDNSSVSSLSTSSFTSSEETSSPATSPRYSPPITPQVQTAMISKPDPPLDESCSMNYVKESQSLQMVPMKTPMFMKMEAIFTMSLDEANRIERFHMACYNFWEKEAALVC